MYNILHVVTIYFVLPYYIGGQFVYFKEKGYELYIACSPSKELAAYAEQMQFNYAEIEITRAITPFKDIKALIKICRYIKENKIDIVVGHTPKGALLAMLASYLMRVPKRIYFRHSLTYETLHGILRGLMINIDRLTALCASKIVCVSQSLYNKSLVDKLNPKKKQLILGKGTCGGIDAVCKFNPKQLEQDQINELRKRMHIDADATVIGYCGRLVRDKGIVELLEAFSLLKKSMPKRKLMLMLVGDFEERDGLPEDSVNIIRNDPDIIRTGFISENIEYYYGLMDVFVLPSYREGFNTAVLEASAMEIPVLTTKRTGCIDTIEDGITGLFVDNSAKSIFSGLRSIIENPDAKKYGIHGRRFVLKYFDHRILWPIIENDLYN